MRIVFMGTPEFAARSLEALLTMPSTAVVGVCTQPPRPARRGKKLRSSPVHELAEQAKKDPHSSGYGLTLLTPETFRQSKPEGQAALAALQDLAPELCVVVAYGLILPRAVLESPRLGCVNLHASLLPRWRGAAPIQRALMAGDVETGVQLMQMEAGLDTGPILATERLHISRDDTGGTLHDKLATCGARLLAQNLPALERGELAAVPQAQEGLCYAAKLTAEDRIIDFERPADSIVRQIAALTPAPGARAQIFGQSLKILKAQKLSLAGPSTHRAGDIISADPKSGKLIIACGRGAVNIEKVQPESGRIMDAGEWLRGRGSHIPHRN